jgi:hypothetical protein
MPTGCRLRICTDKSQPFLRWELREARGKREVTPDPYEQVGENLQSKSPGRVVHTAMTARYIEQRPELG